MWGTSLLFEARTGILHTKLHRAKFTTGTGTVCDLCGGGVETTEHMLIQCTGIVPQSVTQEMHMALGFRDNMGRMDHRAVQGMKDRLNFSLCLSLSIRHRPFQRV